MYNQRLIFAALFASFLWHLPATADDAISSLKKMNTDMCIQMGSSLPDAPKDAKLAAPYCNCVSDSYWDNMPKSEKNEILTRGISSSSQATTDARLNATQLACKKKIGF